jgi:hypothetical protein
VYWSSRVNGAEIGTHRIIRAMVDGVDIPPGLVVDHRDGNPLNNHPDNLRVKTHRENSMHRGSVVNAYEAQIRALSAALTKIFPEMG